MAENFLYIIGRAIVPKRIRPNLRLHLLKAGYTDVPYTTFGLLFIMMSVLSYLLYIIFFYRELRQHGPLEFGFLSFVTFAVVMFLLVFVCFVFLYFHWNVKIYKRTKELESLLPDYLTLVSTNLKGGMSFENSLWNSIKPEFGILANEVGLVSKRVMTGNDVSEALNEFAMKYQSPTMRRTVQLILGEMESGGKIVETIDRVIGDMKKSEALKKEMATSTITYMIFIGMLVGLICPVLFALSLQVFTLTSGFIGTVATSGGGAVVGSSGLSISEPSIQKSDFQLFSILAITIISVFSSIIIAIIERGEVRSGLKYIPMFLVSSQTIYFISLGIFSLLFGGIQVGG